MNGATIATIISLVMCIIGILTFISGRLSKAEKEGRLAEKLDTCCRGIDEIKAKLTSQESAQTQQSIMIEKHEQRFVSLENRVKLLEQKGGISNA